MQGGAEPKPELGHEIVVEAVAEKIEGVQNGVENMHRSVMETAKEFSPAQIMSRKTKVQLCLMECRKSVPVKELYVTGNIWQKTKERGYFLHAMC